MGAETESTAVRNFGFSEAILHYMKADVAWRLISREKYFSIKIRKKNDGINEF